MKSVNTPITPYLLQSNSNHHSNNTLPKTQKNRDYNHGFFTIKSYNKSLFLPHKATDIGEHFNQQGFHILQHFLIFRISL